jgi:hypothetical protein
MNWSTDGTGTPRSLRCGLSLLVVIVVVSFTRCGSFEHTDLAPDRDVTDRGVRLPDDASDVELQG